ncbi:flavin-containing monooxygenase [Alkalimarinus alittae]|uniref:NAD(P)/FAD-dependent oxidoreductase n=1 Tax=Alkalimarinus alittae TaxID=2961619 RepID=A0ABY6N2R7_9ALTE|nr:NAD(P)/FAD-dependent oxidoreductase [Alkalimarinus alittae]UZE96315.1 NAD(P)/FAD-dependent oxidoreductase [Alkalimarinus alittae]
MAEGAHNQALDVQGEEYDIVILGSGFSGLCMAIKLKEAGISSFIMLEKSNDVGGTWRENTYPGCACDVQSHLYSYSFEPNPDWTKSYPGGKEIQEYILRCTEKYNLRPSIRFNSEVKDATFDETNARWSIRTSNGTLYKAKSFIMGSGPLHVPSIPSIRGLDTFKGKVFHSAQWDHSYDLKGKNVVSIGTGGSAIQYVPEIAPDVKQLYVFQRTPAWILPRFESRYSNFRKKLFRRIPLFRKLHRARLYFSNEIRVLPIYNPTFAKFLSNFAKWHIKSSLNDSSLVEKMTPDYTIGCKRVLISNKYYPAFNRDNVELVTDAVKEVKENSIVTQDGKERPIDAIILGTGFITDPRIYMKDFTITGLNGRTLLQQWEKGAESYLGINVSGFPNLFQLVGPNTALGHNSVIFMIECQVHYIIESLTLLKKKNARYMNLHQDALESFNQEIAAGLNDTVWSSGCSSWYTQDDGKNFTLWPGTTIKYRARTRRVITEHYHWEGADSGNNVSNTDIATQVP